MQKNVNEQPTQAPANNRVEGASPPIAAAPAPVSYGRAWIVPILGILVMLTGSAIPSALYDVYRQKWGFSTATLTAIFAVYAVAITVSLLLFGPLSDVIGRRPVLLGGLVGGLVSSLLFAAAAGPGWLYLARLLQGLAVGAYVSCSLAYITELDVGGGSRPSLLGSLATVAGGAVGPLFGGFLAQIGSPALPFFVHAGLTAVVIVAIWMLPETVKLDVKKTWRPRTPRVPAAIVDIFIASSLSNFTLWAVGGLYLALGPLLLRAFLHLPGVAVGGALVFAFNVASGGAQIFLRKINSRKALGVGMGLVTGGLIIGLLALIAGITPLFVAATLMAGVGHGMAFYAGTVVVNVATPPKLRGEVLSAFFCLCYGGLALPIVALGVLASKIGLQTSLIAFTALVSVLAIISLGYIIGRWNVSPKPAA